MAPTLSTSVVSNSVVDELITLAPQSQTPTVSVCGQQPDSHRASSSIVEKPDTPAPNTTGVQAMNNNNSNEEVHTANSSKHCINLRIYINCSSVLCSQMVFINENDGLTLSPSITTINMASRPQSQPPLIHPPAADSHKETPHPSAVDSHEETTHPTAVDSCEETTHSPAVEIHEEAIADDQEEPITSSTTTGSMFVCILLMVKHHLSLSYVK